MQLKILKMSRMSYVIYFFFFHFFMCTFEINLSRNCICRSREEEGNRWMLVGVYFLYEMITTADRNNAAVHFQYWSTLWRRAAWSPSWRRRRVPPRTRRTVRSSATQTGRWKPDRRRRVWFFFTYSVPSYLKLLNSSDPISVFCTTFAKYCVQTAI